MAKKEEAKVEEFVPESTSYEDISSHSTHYYPFNCAPIDITVGAIQSGKIYEIWAEESQGKSTFTLEVAKLFTEYWDKKDGKCQVHVVECESAFDLVRAAHIGVDVKRLKLSVAETVEEIFTKIRESLERQEKRGGRLLLIVDTLSAAPTFGALKGEPEAMMKKQKIIREELRRITISLGKTDSTLIFVNQAQIGGDYIAEVAGGIGGGIKFHASVRLFMKKKGKIETILPNGTMKETAIITQVIGVKNKLTTPRQQCEITINNEKGVDKIDTLVRALIIYSNNLKEKQPITIAGSWKTYSFPKFIAKSPTDNPEMEVVKGQNMSVIYDAMATNLLAYDWANYQVYLMYINQPDSVLLKVRSIAKVWEYEKMFFGKKITVLTEHEKELAKIAYNNEILKEEKESKTKKAEEKALDGL